MKYMYMYFSVKLKLVFSLFEIFFNFYWLKKKNFIKFSLQILSVNIELQDACRKIMHMKVLQ